MGGRTPDLLRKRRLGSGVGHPYPRGIDGAVGADRAPQKGLWSRFWGDERGSVGTEYGVLIVIIAVGMAVAAGMLGVAISMALISGADCLNDIANCP